MVTVEDNGRVGGVGTAVAQALRDADVDLPTRELGIPQEFLDHASRSEILDELGLTGPGIAALCAGFAKAVGRPGGTGGDQASAVHSGFGGGEPA